MAFQVSYKSDFISSPGHRSRPAPPAVRQRLTQPVPSAKYNFTPPPITVPVTVPQIVTPTTSNTEKVNRARERIRAAKKTEVVVIHDCYFDILHIDSSCTLQFHNCVAETVKITGDWTVVVLQGLQITGQNPFLLDTPFLCTLSKCHIFSSAGPILLTRGCLKLKKCTVKVVGCKIFSLGEKCQLQVKASKLSVFDDTEDVVVVSFAGKGTGATLELNTLKLKTRADGLAKLYDSAPELSNEEFSMDTKSCQIFVKFGIYLTLPPQLSRTAFNFTGNTIHDKHNHAMVMSSVNDLALIEQLLSDPAHESRVLNVRDNIHIEQPLTLRGNCLTLQGVVNIQTLDNEEIIDASTFSESICISGKGDSFLYENQNTPVVQVKYPDTKLETTLTLEKCKINIQDLKLAGVYTFEDSQIVIRDCHILGALHLTNCSLQIICSKFYTESTLQLTNCKIEVRNSEFLFSNITGTDCYFSLNKCKLSETDLQLRECRNVVLENSKLFFSKDALIERSLISIFACVIEGNLLTSNCMTFDPNLSMSKILEEAVDFP